MTINSIGFNPVVRSHGNVYMLNVEGKFHIVSYYASYNSVYSVLPCDCPKGGGLFFAEKNDKGIKYVSSGRTRNAANRQWRKHVLEETYA